MGYADKTFQGFSRKVNIAIMEDDAEMAYELIKECDDEYLEKLSEQTKKLVIFYCAEYNFADLLDIMMPYAKEYINATFETRYEKLIPVFVAADNGHLDMVKKLLDHNAKNVINDGRGQLKSLLGFAIEQQQNQIAEYLIELEESADGCVTSNYAKHAFKCAISHNNVYIFDLFLPKIADVNNFAYKDIPPIHTSIAANSLYMTKTLIEHGADVNRPITKKSIGLNMAETVMPNSNGFLVLHAAIKHQVNDNIIDLLLNQGVNVNAKLKNGFSPLYLAVTLKDKKNALKLIKHGADINQRTTINNKKNITKHILDLAIEKTQIEIIEAIIEHKDFDKNTQSLRKLMEFISTYGYKDLLVIAYENNIFSDDITKYYKIGNYCVLEYKSNALKPLLKLAAFIKIIINPDDDSVQLYQKKPLYNCFVTPEAIGNKDLCKIVPPIVKYILKNEGFSDSLSDLIDRIDACPIFKSTKEELLNFIIDHDNIKNFNDDCFNIIAYAFLGINTPFNLESILYCNNFEEISEGVEAFINLYSRTRGFNEATLLKELISSNTKENSNNISLIESQTLYEKLNIAFFDANTLILSHYFDKIFDRSVIRPKEIKLLADNILSSSLREKIDPLLYYANLFLEKQAMINELKKIGDNCQNSLRVINKDHLNKAKFLTQEEVDDANHKTSKKMDDNDSDDDEIESKSSKPKEKSVKFDSMPQIIPGNSYVGDEAVEIYTHFDELFNNDSIDDLSFSSTCFETDDLSV